jgi:flagellar motility protein MotE (MotC chaperone)
MREPIRLLTVLAFLMGGLFGLKALSVANGAADWWEAHASALVLSETAQDETAHGDDAVAEDGDHTAADSAAGDHADAPAAVEDSPLMPAGEVSAAFAERIASGMRTAEEDRVLYRLRQRSAELDSRENELETREALMLAMEQRVDGKIEELNTLRSQIMELTDSLSEREGEDMQVIVDWYGAMDPGDAAERIASLDMETQIQIASRMSQRKFGPILAEMTPEAAAAVTQRMATRSDLPETVAELEARLANGG